MWLSKRQILGMTVLVACLVAFAAIGIGSRGAYQPPRSAFAWNELPLFTLSENSLTHEDQRLDIQMTSKDRNINVRLRDGAIYKERSLFRFKEKSEAVILGRIFSRVLSERLGILAPDPFLARLKTSQSDRLMEVLSGWDMLWLQRNLRGEGALVRVAAKPKEPFWAIEDWKTLATTFSQVDTDRYLELLLQALQEKRPDILYSNLLEVTDQVSFAKWHIMKTLRGQNPARAGNVTLFWDRSRGRWEWVEDDLDLLESGEFDGEVDLIFDEMTRMLLGSPQITLIRNALLWEIVKDDHVIDLWKEVLEGLGHQMDSKDFARIEKIIRRRFTKIRETFDDYSLKLNAKPPKIHVQFKGKTDHYIESVTLGETTLPVRLWLSPQKLMPLFQSRMSYAASEFDFELDLRKHPDLVDTPWKINVSKVHRASRIEPRILSSLPRLEWRDLTNIYRMKTRRGVPHTFLYSAQIESLMDSHPIAIPYAEGEYDITQNILVPAGATLVLSPGVHLRLAPGVSIISEGRIEFRGTAQKPIKITSLTPEPWGAIVLRGRYFDREPSTFRHVFIQNASQTEYQNVVYTGAISLYDADALIENVFFSNNKSPDALNARYSTAILKDSVFDGNSGDAIDFDFSFGGIFGTTFTSNGNDAIDISFSEIEIANNQIEGLPDKGISVGEKSLPIIRKNKLIGNNIGIAVKDLSIARIEDCLFKNNNAAISTYEKKGAFGIGEVVARNNVFIDNKSNHAT